VPGWRGAPEGQVTPGASGAVPAALTEEKPRQIRELDIDIQRVNWEVDLLAE